MYALSGTFMKKEKNDKVKIKDADEDFFKKI